MKKWIVLLLILMVGLKAKGQDYTDEIKLMTDSAISINYAEMRKYVDKKLLKTAYFDNLFIINEYNEPLDYLRAPVRLNLKRLNLSDRKSKKIVGKGVNVWKVITSLKNDKFYIVIIDLYVTYKKSVYNLSNGGGLEVIFQYSHGENRWLLLSTKRGSV